MTTLKNVVLIGAGGTLGKQILKELVSDQSLVVTVLSRPESKSRFDSVLDERVVKIDHSLHVELKKAFSGQDVVICCTPMSAVPQQRVYIDVAIEAGVQRFIVNEFANSPDSQGVPELEAFRIAKRAILAYAVSKAEEYPKFSWSAVAPGPFLDLAIREYPIFGFTPSKRQAQLIDHGKQQFVGSLMADVAKATVNVLKFPTQTKNRFVQIRSLLTTQAAILAAFERRQQKQTQTQTEAQNQNRSEHSASASESGGESGSGSESELSKEEENRHETWTVLESINSDTLLEAGREALKQGDTIKVLQNLLPYQTFSTHPRIRGIDTSDKDNELLDVQEITPDDLVRVVLDD